MLVSSAVTRYVMAKQTFSDQCVMTRWVNQSVTLFSHTALS